MKETSSYGKHLYGCTLIDCSVCGTSSICHGSSGSGKATILDDPKKSDLKPLTSMMMMMPKVFVVHNTERLSENQISTMKEGSGKLEM